MKAAPAATSNPAAARSASAGVPVIARCYDDMVHGFFGMGVLPGGMATATEICAAMGALLHDDGEVTPGADR